jgi:hypothetical protein
MLRMMLFAGLLVLAAPAAAQDQSATWSNNCGSETRCVRVYHSIAETNFCLRPGQSFTVYGLARGATYCAWCSTQPLPVNCQEFRVEFD